MRALNLGILAHVDAGKTTLTERLLYAAGVLDEIGSVDQGSTHTDSLALERQGGITIKSAVVSFVIAASDGPVSVNLIDTPGHPDFIAEVERVLHVLDGAVLVVSAVEGVQAQTRVLMRALQRLRIPTLAFVNKIDRGGAAYEPVLEALRDKLTPAVAAMGSVGDIGTRSAEFVPFDASDAAFTAAVAEMLADHDDTVLSSYVDGDGALASCDLRGRLAAHTKRARVHPVFFGSAITGAGVDALMGALVELLPAMEGDADGPVSATVFKVDRGPASEKIAYVRMFSGVVRTRDRLPLGGGGEGKVTAISVFDRGGAERRDAVAAGQIGQLWGLGDVQIGDAIGADGRGGARHHFAPPTLETVVVPRQRSQTGALHMALTQLAEQDPLINLRQDDVRQELFVSLYGEVQKEVIQATLAADFGLEVEFRATTTICIERVVGMGEAVETMPRGRSPNRPFLAGVGLRVEPGEVGSGVQYHYEIELGSLPPAFHKAIEETVPEALRQGLYGWEVTDCRVALTHSGYAPRQSHSHATFDKAMSSIASDFRNLTPLVLMSALQQAGTKVHEPIHRFTIEAPADCLAPVLTAVARLLGVAQTQAMRGSSWMIEGEIPAARVHELQQQLPALTRGEGVLDSAFDSYQPVRGAPPVRPRTDHNPLNRKEYLLRVERRV